MNMSDSIKEVLYTEEQLQARVKELGAQITKDYAGKDKILLVSVLRGSYIFMADLSRAIDLPCLIDFMVVSSYGAGTSSSGQVEIKKDISSSIEDYHVIIVEDILDSGNTLYYLLDVLKLRKAASIRICTLLDKPEPASEAHPGRLHRICSAGRLCGRLRTGLQPAVSQPALHWRVEGRSLQLI